MKFLNTLILFASLLLGASCLRIPYPRGKTMESVVHHYGSLFLMSDYVTGNIMMMDVRDRRMYTVVTAPANRTIQGIEYIKKKDLVIACGGGAFLNKFIQDRMEDETDNVANVVFPQVPTGIFLYNLTLGTPYVSCPVPGAVVINDVTIDRREKYAYISDTRRAVMYRMNLNSLPSCDIEEIPLPKEDFDPESAFFGGAGMAYYKKGGIEGVIIGAFTAQAFWFYDVKTKEIYKMGSTCGSVDGFKLVRDRCILGALNIPLLNKYRVRINKKTMKLTTTCEGNIPDPKGEMDYPTAMAVSGTRMLVANQNTTLLGETGFLEAALVKIPGYMDLC